MKGTRAMPFRRRNTRRSHRKGFSTRCLEKRCSVSAADFAGILFFGLWIQDFGIWTQGLRRGVVNAVATHVNYAEAMRVVTYWHDKINPAYEGETVDSDPPQFVGLPWVFDGESREFSHFSVCRMGRAAVEEDF